MITRTNLEINNGIRDYVRTLHSVNANFIKIAAYDAIRNKDEDYILASLISEIVRLLPYVSKRELNVTEIDFRSGIMEYRNEYNYLEKEFDELLKDHYELIINLKKIRNKYQHKMQALVHDGTTSGSDMLLVVNFHIGDDEYNVDCNELLRVIMHLNSIYGTLLKDVIKKYDIKDYHPYYENLKRFDFHEYNKVLKSTELKSIGKIFLNYFY